LRNKAPALRVRKWHNRLDRGCHKEPSLIWWGAARPVQKNWLLGFRFLVVTQGEPQWRLPQNP
jgi:hypothetical protein